MAIDPTTTTTVKVGELASAGFNASDLVPHEVSGILKKGTLGDLATFIGGQIEATSGVGFRAVQVSDGQTLPATTEQEFILVGPGTFPNVGGGATITLTEELNALVSNGTYWFVGVEIPIQSPDGAFEPAISTGTTSQYWRGDKTWQTLDKTAVGLANVDNTSDANKPISIATQTALDLKANDNAVVKLTGDQTVAGIKTFSSFLKSGLLFINEAGGFGSITGYTQLGGTADYFQVINGTNTKSTKFIHNGARNLTMPSIDGTLALTSQIPTVSGTTNYLPKFTGASSLGNSLIYDNGTNVGIGTTAPGAKLELYGNYVNQKFNDGTRTGVIAINSDPSDPQFRFEASNNFVFANSAERMRITSTGNVGIGTTAPGAKLDVLGGIRWGNGTIIGELGYSSRAEFGTVSNHNLGVTTNSITRMLIDISGNVGIATTAPTEKLEVSGNAKATSFIKSGGTSSQFLMADGSVSTGSSGYKVYVALIGQTGTNAPTVTVLENTIGSIVWSYVTPGVYFGTLSNAFTAAKTTCEISTVSNMSNVNFSLQRNNNANQVFLQTLSSGTATNGLLGALNDNSAKIEIRVYN